ncbi:hypothetical protein JHK82_012044 [Glycine max]|nr:hypothetical protein JHK82_012044 [Glycine max]
MPSPPPTTVLLAKFLYCVVPQSIYGSCQQSPKFIEAYISENGYHDRWRILFIFKKFLTWNWLAEDIAYHYKKTTLNTD